MVATRRSVPAAPAAVFLAAVTLLAVLAPLGAAGSASAGGARVAATSELARPSASVVTGNITGPSSVAVAGHATYRVQAEGGPALAANGTVVGELSYSANIIGDNTTGGAVNPPQGVLINGSANLTLICPNISEALTLYVDVTSTYNGQNSSTNLTYAIDLLTPILLIAGLKVVGPTSVKAFSLAILLDGSYVGSVAIPSLTSGQNYPVTFSYLGQGLAPGWHTFTISLAEEHGLVLFQNNLESYTTQFYIPGPAPDSTDWILAGVAAFLAVLVISVTLFGARRKPKGKA